jgi:hypothetical protein
LGDWRATEKSVCKSKQESTKIKKILPSMAGPNVDSGTVVLHGIQIMLEQDGPKQRKVKFKRRA